MYVHIYGQVCSPVCECVEIRGQHQVSSIALHRVSEDLELTGQQAPGILLFPSLRTGVTEAQPDFYVCVMGLWTHLLMLMQLIFYPLSHLPSPPNLKRRERALGLRHRDQQMSRLVMKMALLLPQERQTDQRVRAESHLSIFCIYTAVRLMPKSVLQLRRF